MRFFNYSIVFCFIGFGSVCSAQNYAQQFANYADAADTTAQLELLIKWENENPDDVELYACYFNYYFGLAKYEYTAIEEKPNSAYSLEMFDSINNIKAYINTYIDYKNNYISRGFEYANKGIKKFPNRLDLRFGKAHVYSKLKYWDDYTNTILKTIDYSYKNKNAWLWANNEVINNPKEFFLSTIQEYTKQLYDLEDDSLIPLMQKIALKVLEYYPNQAATLSNLSVTYILQGEYNKALNALLKAEELTPEDYIVMSNIAQAYKLKGDIENSIRYYEKTIEYGNEQAKTFATEQIRLLKNK